MKRKLEAGDDRFYKLKRDENGNGAAIIRFLPDPKPQTDVAALEN